MVEAQVHSKWLRLSINGVYCSEVESYVDVDGFTCPVACRRARRRGCPLRK